ncbi:protein of unknown function [Sphingomonas guangdongensis]|uniref:DUF1521 domain-containing protein n=1 Tax=Sphingomonas guangdongensis TaxID=1141890 RepID=A0A285QX12_9SPHN|nr:DUF1521 domain-containing protein [Sphingomonas guangdongensis]SOB86463.1 protein of unknown function [Sphingomonas guangdongensis]
MTVNALAATNASIGFIALSQLAGTGWNQLAAGILVQAAGRLLAGPFAQSCLPATASLNCGVAGREPLASWTASTTGTHTAALDLGDGYSLKIDERNSEMTIFNAATGENTRIWGDPHVEVDGKHAFDFWGTTTFQLENGTKITINTEQFAGNPNMYVASQVVITKGNNSAVIEGISQNQLGDLSVSVGGNGYALDAAHRDGWTVQENASGSGWRADHGGIATQADADITRPGEAYGPGATAPSLGEFWQLLGTFLAFGRLDIGADAALSDRAAIRAFARLV